MITLLSVVVPAYNEEKNIEIVLHRLHDAKSAYNIPKEIIVIDDCSTDNTKRQVEKFKDAHPDASIMLISHDVNKGKGAALRTGIQKASGDLVIVQDADLEYDPRDYNVLLQPIQEGKADVVYGSRFLGAPHRVTMFWHLMANRLLTFMTNILYNTILTDMETGYKVFRREVIENIKIRAKRFDFEPEFTAKVLKHNYRIFEVPISFNPRDYSQGKKIGMKDAFEAVWTLLKYRFMD